MHFLAVFAAAFLALAQATFSPAVPMTPANAAARASVIFGGDMMFDRTIRTTIEKEGGDFIFSCIDSTLQSADLVVANLEGPITGNVSQSVGTTIGSRKNFVFTFPLGAAALLSAHHIGMVNLGNNHIMNFGSAGVRSTIAALDAARVAHFGSPTKREVAEIDLRGVKLAFINYNEFGGSASTTIEQIQIARMGGEVPIVYAHWGIEYATKSSAYSRELAHRFVDAGAAIVIGSHPHVVQEHEVYKSVPIYYSLGNFIFDQYWSDDVRHGLLLRVSFNSRGVASIEEIPVKLGRDRRTCPVY